METLLLIRCVHFVSSCWCNFLQYFFWERACTNPVYSTVVLPLNPQGTHVISQTLVTASGAR